MVVNLKAWTKKENILNEILKQTKILSHFIIKQIQNALLEYNTDISTVINRLKNEE